MCQKNNMKSWVSIVLLMCYVLLSSCTCNFDKDTEKIDTYKVSIGKHSAVTPINRTEEWWEKRHQDIVNSNKNHNPDMIFIGDSITACWEATAPHVWGKYYSRRNAVNMGFGGDRTQHVLWRLNNGEIAGIQPKLAVLMIGVNNSVDNSPNEISEGVVAICQKLRADLPQTKILILAILPVDQSPSLRRAKIAEVNKFISTLADDKFNYYMDIGSIFLDKEGMLSKDIMFDYVHLTPKGYEMFAETIEPIVTKLME